VAETFLVDALVVPELEDESEDFEEDESEDFEEDESEDFEEEEDSEAALPESPDDDDPDPDPDREPEPWWESLRESLL